MVHRYPAAIKAFYMKPDPERPELALGVDVLAPEGYGEIIGGGQRLDDLDLLLQRIEEHKLPQEAFEWYLDLRRYGTVPHGGFGMGIERVVAWICGLEHVRETIPYPRMLYRCIRSPSGRATETGSSRGAESALRSSPRLRGSCALRPDQPRRGAVQSLACPRRSDVFDANDGRTGLACGVLATVALGAQEPRPPGLQ